MGYTRGLLETGLLIITCAKGFFWKDVKEDSSKSNNGIME